jgi:hypothetical protein
MLIVSGNPDKKQNKNNQDKMILKKSNLEHKSKLPETMLDLISGIKNMRIGIISKVISPNSRAPEKHFRVPLSPSIIYFHQHIKCMCWTTCPALCCMLWEIPEKPAPLKGFPRA